MLIPIYKAQAQIFKYSLTPLVTVPGLNPHGLQWFTLNVSVVEQEVVLGITVVQAVVVQEEVELR